MADGFVQVPADSVGKRVDGASLDVSTVAVIRQRIVIGDNSAVAEFAVVSAGSLQVSFAATQPVNISNTPSVILAAGAANIGTINNISAVVAVTGGVAISGTAQVAIGTPFTVNNISATTIVAGAVTISLTPSVVLAAGAANIGAIDFISRTAQVAIGTPFTVNNISATTIVAGAVTISLTPSVILAAGTANFGTLNNISATVNVAIGAISAGVSIAINAISAGVTIGINSISATVNTVVVRQYASLTVNTASHGPRMVLASTSANATLVGAPGAGLAVYVTMVAASNASGTNTRGRFGTSATVGALQMMMAASGGGFVMQLDPPWKLSTNEALVCSVKPNVSEGMFNCNFFVASADAF